MTNAYIPEPEFELRDGTPVAAGFDDVYFSRSGGVAETEHVFLAGNGLPERWAGCERFTVAELGFGTGLNFLVAWKRFRETAPKDAVLHFLSVEKFPFKVEILRALLAQQTELREEAAQLLAVYPLRLPGMHRVHLPQAVLTLYFGEVTDALREWGAGQAYTQSSRPLTQPSPARGEGFPAAPPVHHSYVDAWFLDGFSPAKNAAMWSEEVLQAVGRLSGLGTTFATFTAAGAVKRGLMAAGFAVEKRTGFGSKREMLVGKWAGAAGLPLPAGEATRLNERSEFSRSGEGAVEHECADSRPHPDLQPSTSGAWVNPTSPAGRGDPARRLRPNSALVIGAGIAGASIARALAERGVAVTVIAPGGIADGASGNAAGVLFPQLTKRWNVAASWYFTAYGFMLRQLQHWRADVSAQPGMLRLPRDADEAAQLRELNETLGLDREIVHWLTREEASAQAGVELQTGAAFFPQGSWVDPGALCRFLLQHGNITVCEGAAATQLMRVGDAWRVALANGREHVAPVCVVAAAGESAILLADYRLKLGAVGGQVSEIAAGDVAAPLRSIVCLKGYVIPLRNRYLIGATYHREDLHAVTDARHAENVAELEAALPGWLHGDVIGGRSAVRATTPDRLPYVGVVDQGLYVSTGHGSRGMLSAPIAAEIIAAQMCGEPPVVSATLRSAVNPLRFKR